MSINGNKRLNLLSNTTLHDDRLNDRDLGLDDGAEVGAPPGPGAVSDNVGRVGVEWSVVCVELARLVRRTVVVRVTDR